LISKFYEKSEDKTNLATHLLNATPIGQLVNTSIKAGKELGVGDEKTKISDKQKKDQPVNKDEKLLIELVYYLVKDKTKYKKVLDYIYKNYNIDYRDFKFKRKYKFTISFNKLLKKVSRDILKEIKRLDESNQRFYLEFSIKDLWTTSSGSGSGNAVSDRNKKFYSIRKQFNNTFFLRDVKYDADKGDLTLKIEITPTYKPKEVINITPEGNETKGKKYTGIIEFTDLNELFNKEDWNSIGFRDKRDIVYNILDSADVKIFVNDPSFLYQGSWRELDEIGMAYWPFPNLPDKGIWKKRHGGYDPHITKHLVGLFSILKPNADKIVKAIDEGLK
jgi:hypothetical protein